MFCVLGTAYNVFRRRTPCRQCARGYRTCLYDCARGPEPVRSHSAVQKDTRYQCTFCCKPFPGKYEWRRHEESVHAPQKEWICKIGNYGNYGVGADPPKSSVCLVRYSVLEAFGLKSYIGACRQKPERDRIFYRKDH